MTWDLEAIWVAADAANDPLVAYGPLGALGIGGIVLLVVQVLWSRREKERERERAQMLADIARERERADRERDRADRLQDALNHRSADLHDVTQQDLVDIRAQVRQMLTQAHGRTGGGDAADTPRT